METATKADTSMKVGGLWWYIFVRPDGEGFRATYQCSFNEGSFGVLGRWPTREAAIDAAKCVLNTKESGRLCDLRDIEEARKLRRSHR